jgi:hypothetical protein
MGIAPSLPASRDDRDRLSRPAFGRGVFVGAYELRRSESAGRPRFRGPIVLQEWGCPPPPGCGQSGG